MRRTSLRIWTRRLASRFESGSSIRKTAGSRTSALPIATRCRWPPESWRGFRATTSESPSTSAASRAFRSRSCLRHALHPEREGDVLENVEMRVEGVVLEDHCHVPLLGGQVVDDLSVEPDRARGNRPRARRPFAVPSSSRTPMGRQGQRTPRHRRRGRENERPPRRCRRSWSPARAPESPSPPPTPTLPRGSRPASRPRPGSPTQSREPRAIASEPIDATAAPLAEIAILGSPPAVQVAEGTRQRHSGQAAELLDRPAVDRIDLRVEDDVGQVGPGRKVVLLDAVDDRAAFERDTPANGVDARVRGGKPRRDVDLDDHAVTGLPSAVSASRTRPPRPARRRQSLPAPSSGSGATASTRHRCSRPPRSRRSPTTDSPSGR